MKKQKSLFESKQFQKLLKQIREAKKDPDFVRFIKEFVKYHSGRTS